MQPKTGLSSLYTMFHEAPNIRCNQCGKYGASWYTDERPGWGCIALCPEHAHELDDEYKRHSETLMALRKINYEQQTGTVKALSVKEPWITLIVSGQKTIETRTWTTKHRGDLLLVGCKKPVGPYSGKTACVVKLMDCRPMTSHDEEAAGCQIYYKAMAWMLEDVRPVVLQYVTGHQRLYDVEQWKCQEVES